MPLTHAVRQGQAWHEKCMSSDELWHYAKICRVANVMRAYLESLS